MSDIVERLRDRNFVRTFRGWIHVQEAADTITTLRAEVERLTAENASLASWQCEFTDGKTGLVYSEGGGTYCAMAKREATLRATNERLRAALEEIEQVAVNYVHMKYAKLARAALAEEKKG